MAETLPMCYCNSAQSINATNYPSFRVCHENKFVAIAIGYDDDEGDLFILGAILLPPGAALVDVSNVVHKRFPESTTYMVCRMEVAKMKEIVTLVVE